MKTVQVPSKGIYVGFGEFLGKSEIEVPDHYMHWHCCPNCGMPCGFVVDNIKGLDHSRYINFVDAYLISVICWNCRHQFPNKEGTGLDFDGETILSSHATSKEEGWNIAWRIHFLLKRMFPFLY